jgi:hypothetical protein
VTFNTGIGIDCCGRMIAFHVEFLRKLKDIPGAVFDAKTTALATLFDDMNITVRDLYLVKI